MNLEKDSIDPLKQLEYEFYERVYLTHIKYYIGLHYYLTEHKYTEAQLVLSKVSSDIESTIEFAQKGNLQSGKIKRELEEMQDSMIKNI